MTTNGFYGEISDAAAGKVAHEKFECKIFLRQVITIYFCMSFVTRFLSYTFWRVLSYSVLFYI